MTEPTTTPRKFETATCSRCCGTGNYSYCQMYGSRCFKCGGSGRTYTRRGEAAVRFLKAMRTRKASEVCFGDWVYMSGVPGFSKGAFFKVETLSTVLETGTYLKDGVMVPSPPRLHIDGTTVKGESVSLGTFPDSEVTLGFNKAAKTEQVRLALDYQDTLTKAGTVRKR